MHQQGTSNKANGAAWYFHWTITAETKEKGETRAQRKIHTKNKARTRAKRKKKKDTESDSLEALSDYPTASCLVSSYSLNDAYSFC